MSEREAELAVLQASVMPGGLNLGMTLPRD